MTRKWSMHEPTSSRVRSHRRSPVKAVLGLCLFIALAVSSPGCSEERSTPAGLGIPVAFADLPENATTQRQVRRDAVAFLRETAESQYPGFRANAVEALEDEPGVGESLARHAILDDNPGVRFAGAMVIGMKQFKDSAPLVHALLKDDSASVRIAAIFALARNGYEADLTRLAEYLMSQDLTARSNAAIAIGELGDPTAIEMLREALDYTNPRATVTQQRLSDLQVAEAMAKLGDDSALSRIRAHLRAAPDEGEVAALAASMLGGLNARVYKRDLMNIVAAWKEYRYPAEVRLAAMASLAQMGQEIPVALPIEYFAPEYEDTTPGEFRPVRIQATYVLGQIGGADSIPYLADLFYNWTEPAVRIQAASALRRLLPLPESDQSE